MFALCDKKETKSETPEAQEVREKIFSEKFEAKAKRYLAEIRRQAMIEYKTPRTEITPCTLGADARRAGRNRPRPRARGVAPRVELDLPPFYLIADRIFSTAPRISARRADRRRDAAEAAARFARASGRRCRPSGDRRAGPSRSIECAGRHRLDPARRADVLAGGRRHRHQSGRQERALPFGFCRTRPYRISGHIGPRSDRQVAAAGDDAVVAGTCGRAGDDPSAAARGASGASPAT